MPWLTPNSPAPTDRFCRRVSIPNDPTLIQAVSGALLPLTYPSNWEQSGSMTPDEAAEIMRSVLIEFFDAVGCPTMPAPYWDEDSSADDEELAATQTWYGVVEDFLAPIEGLSFEQNAAAWAITGFVAYAAGPGAAVFFRTVARRFVLAFQRGDVGEIIRVVVDSAEYGVDTSVYAPGEIIELPIIAAGAGAEHDILIVGTGSGTRGVVRKQLDEEEMDAIVNIQQFSGQLRFQRRGDATWYDATDADNVRRDGTVSMTGNLRIKAASEESAALTIRPIVGERGIRITTADNSVSQQAVGVGQASGNAGWSVTNAGRQQSRLDDNNAYAMYALGGEIVAQFGTLTASPLLILTGRTGQSADILRVANRAGAVLASVSPTGYLRQRGGVSSWGATSIQERQISTFDSVWAGSTDATRRGRVTVNVFDWNASREIIRGEADGTQGLLGFLGATAIARPTVSGTRQQNAALASLLTALASYGLITDSTTAGDAPYAPPAPLTVSGERDGNPALASLVSALQVNGLITNTTTAGTRPVTEMLTDCDLAHGFAARFVWQAIDIVSSFRLYLETAGDIAAGLWASYYIVYNSANWVNESDEVPLTFWLEANFPLSGTARTDALEAWLDWIALPETKAELARVAYCSTTDIRALDFTTFSEIALGAIDQHPFEPNWVAVNGLINTIPVDRLRYLSIDGGLLAQGSDCADLDCPTSYEVEWVQADSNLDAVIPSLNNTVIGAAYTVRISGVWENTAIGGTVTERDACYARNKPFGGEFGSWNAFDTLRINGVWRGGDLPLDEVNHSYVFNITGDGNPIVVRISQSILSPSGGATIRFTGEGM